MAKGGRGALIRGNRNTDPKDYEGFWGGLREGLSHCLSSFLCNEVEQKKRVAKARPEGRGTRQNVTSTQNHPHPSPQETVYENLPNRLYLN